MERHVKEGLDHMRQALTELEASARKLQNQNFADIVQSAHRRVTQLSEHPDLEAVHDQLKADPGLEGAEDAIGGPNTSFHGEAFEPGKGDFKEPLPGADPSPVRFAE